MSNNFDNFDNYFDNSDTESIRRDSNDWNEYYIGMAESKVAMPPKKKADEPAPAPQEPVEPLDDEAEEEEDEDMDELAEDVEAVDLENDGKERKRRGGRKPKTPNVVVEGKTYYAAIDTASGVATVFHERPRIVELRVSY
eukprot:g53603.t1